MIINKPCACCCRRCECSWLAFCPTYESSPNGEQLQLNDILAPQARRRKILLFFLPPCSWRPSTPYLRQNNRTTWSLWSIWGTTSVPCRTLITGKCSSLQWRMPGRKTWLTFTGAVMALRRQEVSFDLLYTCISSIFRVSIKSWYMVKKHIP